MGSSRKSSAKPTTPPRQRASTSRVKKSGPSPAKTPKTMVYSHHLPSREQKKGNGRQVGRNLIIWSRPRMADKLLQHIMFECARHKVTMPWDAIAHRFHPGSSGTAIIQHLNRTRKELIAEGHLVPPMAHGAEATQDPNVRGYIRKDSDGSDCETTRPVLFNENVDDLRVNLPCGVVTDDDMETSTQLNTPDEEHSENESSPNPLLASSLWPTLYSTPTKRRGATPQQYNPVEMAGQSMDSYLTSPSVMRHGEMNDERYVAPPSFPGHSDGGSFSSFGQFDHNGGQFLGCNDPFDFQLEEYTPDDSGSGTDNSFVGNGQMLIEHAVTTDSDSGSPANMGSVELSTQDVTPGLADFLNESSISFF